jgi:hypothetical protein
MRFPPGLHLRNTIHGTGERGMAYYVHEDTAGLGIVMTARRESSRAPFVETWRFRWLPDQVFSTVAELARALEQLTDEQIAAEKARWPSLGTVRELAGTNSPNTCMRHRDRPAVIQAGVDTCWIRGQGLIASLCEECRPAATGNGQGVVDIMEERRRKVAAMKSPLAMILEGKKP